jgi:hypothetical protein
MLYVHGPAVGAGWQILLQEVNMANGTAYASERTAPLTMKRKLNCWEFKKCGRQPQGHHELDLGVCPAATENALDDIHEGTNSGRACWVVSGTFCQGKVQGTFAQKFKNCEVCDFYQQVRREEGGCFKFSAVLLAKLRK